MAQVKKFYADNTLRIGMCDGVVVMHLSMGLKVAHIQTIERAYLAALESRGTVVGLAHVVPGVTGGAESLKEASSNMMKNLGKRVAIAALIFEDTGMRGMVFRTAVRGINIVSRGTQLRTYATQQEAAQEMAPVAGAALGRAVTSQELLDAMREVQAYA